jgi:hypothetical protein
MLIELTAEPLPKIGVDYFGAAGRAPGSKDDCASARS